MWIDDSELERGAMTVAAAINEHEIVILSRLSRTDYNEMVVFDAKQQKCTEKRQLKFAAKFDSVRNVPVVVDGIIYFAAVKDCDSFLCKFGREYSALEVAKN